MPRQHKWGYAGLTPRRVKLWHCERCRRTVECAREPEASLCDGGAAPEAPPARNCVCTYCGKWLAWDGAEPPQRGFCSCAIDGPTLDAKLKDIAAYALELIGPGAEFFIGVASRQPVRVASMANMPPDRQVAFLRYLLSSFDEGTAAQTAGPEKGTT